MDKQVSENQKSDLEIQNMSKRDKRDTKCR